MASSWKQFRPDPLSQANTAIKYVTENGFSIIRFSDLDPSIINTPEECRFLVQDEQDVEREIKVGFSEDLIARIRMRRRTTLADESMFWLVCAESCLATYLWEKTDYPAAGRLIMNELSPDELMLAMNWRDRDC